MNSPPLQRNQACISCRKRKLKCDAVRPVCGKCKRSKEAALSTRQPSPVPPGDCIYTDDNSRSSKSKKKTPPDDGGVLKAESITKKHQKRKQGTEEPQPQEERSVGMLKARIKHLENMLRQSMAKPNETRPTPLMESTASNPVQFSLPCNGVSASYSPDGNLTQPSLLSTSDNSQSERSRFYQYRSRPRMNFQAGSPHASHSPSQTQHRPLDLGLQHQFRIDAEPDPMLEMLFPGYPADLPSPDAVLHLSEIFFAHHPLGVMVYKPSYMAALTLPPRHPDRPDVSLIHAILGAAAPLSPFFAEGTGWQPTSHFAEFLPPDESEVNVNNTTPAFSASFDRQAPGSRARDNHRSGAGSNAAHMSFADFHLTRARVKVSRALVTKASASVIYLLLC